MLHVSHVALATLPRVCQVSHVLNRSLHVSRLAAAINLKMPSLSPTMEEGQIIKWAKAEGEEIAPGDVVCDIQTDKAVMSMEADDEGVLAKIVKQADSGSIKVGEIIAVVAEDGEDWQTVASAPIGDSEAADSAPPPTSESAPAPAMTGGNTPGTVINMPSLSPTMSEGTIVKWYKEEGESIGAGDVLCDIQTDKAVVSMECDDDGVVAKILISEGASGVVVGTPICLMVEEGQDWKDVAIPATTSGEAAAKPAATEPAAAPSTSVASGGPPAGTEFIHPPQTGPATALLLTQYNINPDTVDKSGPKGNLTKADVLKFIKDKALPTPAPAEVPLPQASAPVVTSAPSQPEVSFSQDTAAFVDIELSNMRKVIAKRLTESKQFAPHGYSTSTADLTAINRLRQEYIKSGFKVSINDFIISAVSTALQYVPQINANVVNDEPQYMSNIDISVAVATPNGLITPIVKNANTKSVQDISAEVKELASKAKENKLKLDEFQGGTFTISNLGMFGIAEFTAIINAPQLAILAVGGGRQVIDPETMRATTVMSATLSFDQRFVDDASAADFMTVFKTLIERPELTNRGFMSSLKVDRIAASL